MVCQLAGIDIDANQAARDMAAFVAALIALPAQAQTPAGIPGVLAPGATPELVQEGYVFTEGPVGTAEGGLYFSDIRVSKTYFLDAAGKISVAMPLMKQTK